MMITPGDDGLDKDEFVDFLSNGDSSHTAAKQSPKHTRSIRKAQHLYHRVSAVAAGGAAVDPL